MHFLTLNCLTKIHYYNVVLLPRNGKILNLINILYFICKILKDVINLRYHYYVVLTCIVFVNIKTFKG